MIKASGSLSVVDNSIFVGEGGAGDYITPFAYCDLYAGVNNTVVGIIFAVCKCSDNLLHFSQRVVGMRASAQGMVTNLSGGGYLDDLEEGDKVSVWVASSLSNTVTVSNANIGLELSISNSMKQTLL